MSNRLKVLIGCERSGIVRRAFRALGHDAWSCDIESSRDSSLHHIQKDLLVVLNDGWDMGIFHPPCTHIAVSGARHFAAKRADGRQKAAIEFFMAIVNAPIEKTAIENPVCVMSSLYRKPDQIIQPWQYGHGETKATCLWLKGLPLLVPTNIVAGREARVHRMAPGPRRAELRSNTYQGIADAMALQWGGIIQ